MYLQPGLRERDQTRLIGQKRIKRTTAEQRWRRRVSWQTKMMFREAPGLAVLGNGRLLQERRRRTDEQGRICMKLGVLANSVVRRGRRGGGGLIGTRTMNIPSHIPARLPGRIPRTPSSGWGVRSASPDPSAMHRSHVESHSVLETPPSEGRLGGIISSPTMSWSVAPGPAGAVTYNIVR